MGKPLGKAIRTLTDEEKKAQIQRQIAQQLMQKREAFAINIMRGLCSNPEVFKHEVAQDYIVETSVSMADKLFEALYPLPETENINK